LTKRKLRKGKPSFLQIGGCKKKLKVENYLVAVFGDGSFEIGLLDVELETWCLSFGDAF
jgi:hypothetical protein